MSEYSFKPGDNLWNILRKLLALLNTSTVVAASSATDPSQGDTSWCFFRKILLRLGELVPEATAEYEIGDSQWALVRKILQVFNENTLVASTPETLFAHGDSLEVISRKILNRLAALAPAASADYGYRAGDSLNQTWRKILSVIDSDVDAPFSPGIPAAPSDLHIAILDWAGKIKVIWQDNSSNESGFEVYTSTNGVEYALADTRGPNIVYSVLEGLLNQSYWVKVRAISGDAVSAFTAPVVVNPFTGGAPDLSATYVDYEITEVDIVVDNIADPPGDVVVYESDNDDLSDPAEVDVITLPPNSGGRTHTISNHGVAITRRNVFARQRNSVAATSGPSPVVTRGDPSYGPTVATDWASRVVTNGGAAPSAATVAAATAFGNALANSGLRTKMKAVNFIAPDNKIAARTPFIVGAGSDPWTLSNGAGDVTWGLTVDGARYANGLGDTSKWIPGINPRTVWGQSPTSVGVTCYMRNNASANGSFISCADAPRYFLQFWNYANTSIGSAIFSFLGDGYAGANLTPGHGYWSANRTASNAHNIYYATPLSAHASLASSAVANATDSPNAAVEFPNGAAGGSYEDMIWSFVAFHDGLTAAQSENLYDAVQTLRVSLGGGFIPDPASGEQMALDWAYRVVKNGGARPSDATIAAAATFYDNLVSANILSKMKALNFIAPDSLTAAITPLIKGPGLDPWTNANFTSGNLSVHGLVGSIANQRSLNTGVVPSTMLSITSAGLSAYVYTGGSSTGPEMGVVSGVGGVNQMTLYTDYSGTSYNDAWSYQAGGRLAYANTNTPGFFSFSRTSASSMKAYYASGLEAISEKGSISGTAGALPDYPIIAFGLAVSGAMSYWCERRLSCLVIHEGLTLGETTSLFNAIHALRITLGGGYIDVPTRDNLESYSDGAALNGLNGGTNFNGAYVARTNFQDVIANDTLESYSDGANVDGLNGGTGWTGAFVGRTNA